MALDRNQPVVNLLQSFGKRRCPCGQSDSLDAVKPDRIEFRWLLDMKDSGTTLTAGLDQMQRVMRLPAADNDDRSNLVQQFIQSLLPIFGWLADGIDPLDCCR